MSKKFNKTGTPEYGTWVAMKTRCHNKKSTNWPWYGGRGISVCQEWRESFLSFLSDMGQKPSPKHSIDRINPNKDYSPSNCRWADSAQQGRNRRNVKKLHIYKGETDKEASIRLGGVNILVRQRIKLGWSLEEAFTTPVGKARAA